MFNHFDWRLLQLFGGEGGASGASPAGDGGNAAAAVTGISIHAPREGSDSKDAQFLLASLAKIHNFSVYTLS